ncbi:hypothetical protein TWF569_002564 [Orbilia oligospora]|uniref:Uncharacterized protein n=1 Tax=Orbilia oligospora TaxID=2813651 RepID=A0A7C8JNF6_ORBOL|nr:hypothetical protein TWF706_009695 [Orbilia oligospora]KAF3102708.1 hypothetical protein TWF102_004378 [Orbilia oligospora]KAF3110439.1 hypothetical protein TWF103_004710 [Orbilia oligospora]KAF3121516.1 hypothetical protein TWF569_002564 [Orbilia oligospora]KAF3123338.1 hypothetical protein TWF594_002455 [Orbilia oligospora]
MSSTYRNLLLLAVAGLAIATPLPQYDSEPQRAIVNETAGSPSWAEMDTMKVITPIGAECFLMGNPHVYPLGLRVGIYLQWFATILANFFVPSVASSMRGINTLFQVAIFSGLSYEITNMDALDGIEVFILLTLCIGSVVCLITSPNMDVKVTRAGHIARLFVFLGIFMFGSWYWFTGYKFTAMTRCTQEILFLFFWKVHLYHWFMGFSQAVMIIGCLACAGTLGYEIYYLTNIIGNDGFKPTLSKALQGKLHRDSALGGVLQQERYAWVSGALLVIIFVITAAFIATVEGALKYSNTLLTFNLGSPVELIPFIIGLFSLLKVFVGMVAGAAKVINDGMSRSRSETPEGKELSSRPSTGAGFRL